MRIDVKKTEVYPFDELSDESKGTAIEKLYDINTDYGWWDHVFYNAKEIAKLMGIDIDNIYYSGFSSQGDGACFDGNYEYKPGSVKAVMGYAPTDTELHRIVVELQKLQKACFYQIRANIKQSGQYYHRFCTDISVDFESHHSYHDYYDRESEKNVIGTLRDFMLWIYQQLEKNYDYYTSSEAIVETIKVNEYEFTKDGKLYR